MLRHVSETSATIWVETDQRCTMEILGRSVPTFCVAGHHYALAIIEGLEPASSIEYDVRLDGEVRWPVPGSSLPASRISDARRSRASAGSCSARAAPRPRTRRPGACNSNSIHAVAGSTPCTPTRCGCWIIPPDEWPELAVFLGDQIYADDSSPKARERIAEARGDTDDGDPESAPPPELVRGFEEYTWLYHESWSPEIERWFFSNVPSVMIFDDHEMIDDWNISDAWVRDIRQTRWWQEHVIGGLMTYWLYQHLGNLSPEAVRSEGLLEALGQVEDGEKLLRDWAMQSEEFTPVAGRYRFNFVRDIGRVRLVMIDSVATAESSSRASAAWSTTTSGSGLSTPATPMSITCSSAPRFRCSCRSVCTTCRCGASGSAMARGAGRVGSSASGCGSRPTWRTGRRSAVPSTRSSRLLGELGDPSAVGCSRDDLGVGRRHPLLVRLGDPLSGRPFHCEPSAPVGELADPQRLEAAREHGDASRHIGFARLVGRVLRRRRLRQRPRRCCGRSIVARRSPTV